MRLVYRKQGRVESMLEIKPFRVTRVIEAVLDTSVGIYSIEEKENLLDDIYQWCHLANRPNCEKNHEGWVDKFIELERDLFFRTYYFISPQQHSALNGKELENKYSEWITG